MENKFTDDDWKLLKDVIDGHDLYSDLVRDEDIEALLTRLEAAENVCHKVKIEKLHDGNYAVGYMSGMMECFQAWRKAAGK